MPSLTETTPLAMADSVVAGSNVPLAVTNYTILIACIFGVGVVAVMRLAKLRDDDGDKLPYSMPANFLFVLTHVFAYLSIVGIAIWSPGLIPELLKAAGINSAITEIPLLAVILMSGLLAIPQIKEIERGYGLFLHSVQYRSNDEQKLAVHLTECKFKPSDAERLLNEKYLHQFNLYIVEHDDSLLSLRSVTDWRKVNALLRRLSQDAENGSSTLSAGDIAEIRKFEEAHRRKTALAISIIRVLRNAGAKEVSPDDSQLSDHAIRLKKVSALLAAMPHEDQNSIAEKEELARQIMDSREDDDAGAHDTRLTFTEKQIALYIREIEGYFIFEYEIILKRLSWLAAKSVVRAGDYADSKLQDLKTAGFAGLGSIQQVTLDRVIWVLFTTWFITFSFWSFMMLLSGRDVRLDIVISIASSTSIAALVGSIWGSRRSLAERRDVPWSSYVVAGGIALACFFLVNTIRYLATHDVVDMAYTSFLGRIAPYSIMPILLTVAICRLARLERWPEWGRTHLRERAKDGFAVASVYLMGFMAVMLFRAAASDSAVDLSHFSFMRLVFLSISLLVGFAIGALIVRDVRSLAHSRIIDQTSPRDQAPAAE